MLASKPDIEKYIPQREPMVMIDELISAEAHLAVTSFFVDETNLFVEDGFLNEAGLVENIAQTAAAQVGYLSAKENLPVPLGFIAAIRNLHIDRFPLTGSQIRTTVTVVNKVLDITIVKGSVQQDGEELCRCEMRIYIKPE